MSTPLSQADVHGSAPLVSVAITTYNRATLVTRAIESVLQQTHRNLEIIVVDDGSTDNTSAVLDPYAAKDARIKVVRHARNRGVNAAKNTALDAARGVYTTLLDSDDELLPHGVETFVRMFDEWGPEYGMMVCNCVDPVSGELTGYGLTQDCELTYQDALCGTFSGQCSGMWRSAVIQGLRFAENEAARENNVWVQIYRRCRVRYKHIPAVKYYRDTPGSEVSIRFDRESARKRLAAAQSYLRIFGTDLERMCPKSLTKVYREVLLYALLSGERRQAWGAATALLGCEGNPSRFLFPVLPFLPRALLAQLARVHFARRRVKSV